MARNPYIITPPEGLPVSLDDAKLHLRITSDDTSQDSVVSRLMVAADDYVSMKLQRPTLVTQFGVKFDGFYHWDRQSLRHLPAYEVGFLQGNSIELPMPPLISVDSVQYINTNGILTTLDPSLYVVDTWSIVGQIYPIYGQVWPTPQPIQNCVTIEFTAGYETTPAAIVSAELLLVSHWFNNRESVLVAGAGVSVEIAQTIDALLAPYSWGGTGAN